MSATKKRVSARARGFLAGLATAGVALFGFGLLASPATATDGHTGTVDTSVTTVVPENSLFTGKGQGGDKGGDDRCKPDVCKIINWCDDKGQDPHPGKLADDAPLVFTGDKGKGHGEKPCIKRPDVDYKCCVSTGKGNAQDVTVGNTAKHGAILAKVQLGDKTPIIKWVEAGQTVTFRFEGVNNGKHGLVVAIKAGKDGKKWCVFKKTIIVVKCPKPSTPPSEEPSTPPTDEPSTPPTSSTPEPSTSTTPAPGGGGGNEPTLPLTGAPVGLLAGGGIAVLAVGATLLFLARRRQRFTA